MPEDDANGSTHWFALAVQPRFDQAVARNLQTRGYETFLPMYRRPQRRNSRLHDTALPLFPGYVCCRFHIHDQRPILTTPGVVQVMGTDHIPEALSEIEIASLQAALRANYPVQPFPYIQAGKRVRIEQGILTGTEGIILSFKETLRLILSITLLQKSVLLEIERDQITESGLTCIATTGD